MEVLIPIAILLAFFWFFVMLPQRRKQREHVAMQDALRVGDEIITAGGVHGLVTGVEEQIVILEIAPETTVRVDRRAIAARVEPDEEELDGDEAEPLRTEQATDESHG